MVRTKAPAIPLLCGLSIGVVLGSRPMSRAKLRVSPARSQLPLSDSHSMVTGRRLTGPKRCSTAASISIALWTFDRRGSRFEADVASEAACLAGEVTAAIVGQPLDGDRQVAILELRGVSLS